MRVFSTTQVGFTLIELMVGLALVAILATLGFPSYRDLLERNRLKQVLTELRADLQYARAEALKRNQLVRFSLRVGNDGAWCYGLTTATSCDCNQANACNVKQIPGSNFGDTDMLGSDINQTFDNRRGTAGATGVTFRTDIYAGRVVVSDVGRVRICAPTGSNMPSGAVALPGIPNCS